MKRSLKWGPGLNDFCKYQDISYLGITTYHTSPCSHLIHPRSQHLCRISNQQECSVRWKRRWIRLIDKWHPLKIDRKESSSFSKLHGRFLRGLQQKCQKSTTSRFGCCRRSSCWSWFSCCMGPSFSWRLSPSFSYKGLRRELWLIAFAVDYSIIAYL